MRASAFVPLLLLSGCSALYLPTRTAVDGSAFAVMKRTWNASFLNYCDVSGLEIPAAPTPLPSTSGQLAFVAIGRGTQNYTCASDSGDDAPEPIGAVATLYNANCVAKYSTFALDLLPRVLYHFGLPDAEHPESPLNAPEVQQFVLGHHYFSDDTTPVFNLDTSNGAMGSIAAAKDSESDPPEDSLPGRNKMGSVAWLYLTANPSVKSGQTYSSVYRIVTVGGSPPETCEGMASQFTVQYAAQYWFFR